MERKGWARETGVEIVLTCVLSCESRTLLASNKLCGTREPRPALERRPCPPQPPENHDSNPLKADLRLEL